MPKIKYFYFCLFNKLLHNVVVKHIIFKKLLFFFKIYLSKFFYVYEVIVLENFLENVINYLNYYQTLKKNNLGIYKNYRYNQNLFFRVIYFKIYLV